MLATKTDNLSSTDRTPVVEETIDSPVTSGHVYIHPTTVPKAGANEAKREPPIVDGIWKPVGLFSYGLTHM